MANSKKPTLVIVLLVTVLMGCIGSDAAGPISSGDENQKQLTAFTNVHLVPMTEEIVLQDHTVLIEADHISDFGPSEKTGIPEHAMVIDGAGAYLMPGLADMHVHIYEESRDEYPISPLNLYIAKGVTTIRDCGTAPTSPSDTFVLEWREEIGHGELVGPTIYSSGRTIHGPVANPGRIVHERYSKGFDFIKLYSELSIDEFEGAQAVAEELGMHSVGHIPYQVGLDHALSKGLDEIAHIEELSFELMRFDNRPSKLLSVDQWLDILVNSVLDHYHYDVKSGFRFNPDEFIQLQGVRLNQILIALRAKDIGVGTTVVAYETVDQKLFEQDKFLRRAENIYLPQDLLEAVRSGQDKHQLMFQMLDENQAIWNWKRALDTFLLRKLHEAGTMLVLGTDSGSTNIGVVEGFSVHDELRILTENGFTPYEALQTATNNSAYVVEKMAGKGDFGTIEVGKRADLLLIEGNPLEEITNTENILGVMAAGRWYSQDELAEMIAIGE